MFARLVWRALLVAALIGMAVPAAAQLPPSPSPLSNTEDARTLPKGTVMLRVLNSWTRFDQVYDATADSAHPLHALGQAFSAESLGVRQFPGLASAQAALRTLTGDPNLALNLGQQFSTVDTRIVTTPLSLSYGVTNRLTLGVMMPVVQTHSTVFVELNPRRLGPNSGANVGPNPAQLGNATAVSSNTNLIGELQSAQSALNQFVTNCTQAGNCPPGAGALLATTTAYLNAVTALYGSGPGSGSAFTPLGAAQTQVLTQLAALQASINSMLGSSYSFDAPGGANAQAALAQLQQLATAIPGVGFDSLGSPDRIGIGDVEVSALFKLMDGFADSTGGVRFRGTIRGVLRLGVGLPPSGTLAYETGTGTGQTSADGGGILDIRLGRRFMATLAGQYTAYFTSSAVARLPNSDYALFPLDVPVGGTWREGNALQLEAMPRYDLTDYFSFDAAYMMRHQAASQYTSPNASGPPVFLATTQQSVGGGFSYSTVARYVRGRSPLPLEMSYTHLETIAASGGLTPQYRRDQIELRIYYRLRRGGR